MIFNIPFIYFRIRIFLLSLFVYSLKNKITDITQKLILFTKFYFSNYYDEVNLEINRKRKNNLYHVYVILELKIFATELGVSF